MSRSEQKEAPKANPMNKLVPYLDLFCRLDDDELGRLAGVEREVCASLRSQVDAINDGLAAYVDLLPRLSDTELVRLTGASDRTVRFWRLCQPREGIAPKPAAAPAPEVKAQEDGSPEQSPRVPTAPHSVVTEPTSETSGRFPAAAPAPGASGKDNSGYVTLSGAPFPGFDHDDQAEAEGVTLEEVEGEPDPLGLNEP